MNNNSEFMPVECLNVPKVLFYDKQYEDLSMDAKLIYPICIQSAGQGPESLNLAACHNCALLPETCCEHGNRLLDRGVVVGTLADNDIGFFSELRDI